MRVDVTLHLDMSNGILGNCLPAGDCQPMPNAPYSGTPWITTLSLPLRNNHGLLENLELLRMSYMSWMTVQDEEMKQLIPILHNEANE